MGFFAMVVATGVAHVVTEHRVDGGDGDFVWLEEDALVHAGLDLIVWEERWKAPWEIVDGDESMSDCMVDVLFKFRIESVGEHDGHGSLRVFGRRLRLFNRRVL